MKVYASQKYVDDKVQDSLNILENLIGYVQTDPEKSFAEVIDDTFAKKTDIPEPINTSDFVTRSELNGELTEFVLKSSTADSAKKFKITVDDSGNITATEVAEETQAE